MTKRLRNVLFMALTLCLHHASEAQAPALTADATATYINTTLHTYPTLEFVASGCSGNEQEVTISEDRRSLIIKQNFALPVEGGTCDHVQTLTAPIFSLHLYGIGKWSKQAQHTSFSLNCTDSVQCFSRRTDAHSTPSGETHWLLRVTAPDEVSDRLEKAVEHLLASLLKEADAHIAGNDPFAKHGR